MVRNLMTAMDERGLGFGFGFLDRSAGFEISESPIPYTLVATPTAQAFLVGLLNTLFVSFLGIILATILGVVVGVARLSPNWLVRRIASGYVELMRNTPLLVQLFLIYFAVLLQLPAVANTLDAARVDLPQPARAVRARPAAERRPSALWLGFVARRDRASSSAPGSSPRRRADAGRPLHGLRVAGWLGLLALADHRLDRRSRRSRFDLPDP